MIFLRKLGKTVIFDLLTYIDGKLQPSFEARVKLRFIWLVDSTMLYRVSKGKRVNRVQKKYFENIFKEPRLKI